MTRKLLPYEHDLIAVLGCTKDEYLEFLSLQKEYSDIKAGTALDIRNDPGTTAIVLTVVGILFQVGAALLAPRPQVPSTDRRGESQTREQRFAPRFGFNSVQELAKYGDAIPLVYTDTSRNPSGGVRIAGSMLWSAVRSYGSNQYLQMLMLLTGGALTQLDPAKSAFGQTPITDLIAQNKWIYFKANGTGVLAFADEASGTSSTDPISYGSPSNNPYRVQPGVSADRVDGFSQVYSPSSSNTFGGYAPVPFATAWFLRDSKGTKYSEDLAVYLNSIGFDYATNGYIFPLATNSVLTPIPLNSVLQVIIAATPERSDFENDFDRGFYEAKANTRRALAAFFDDAGIFKLGSARFRVFDVSNTNLDQDNMVVGLRCIEAGAAPSIPYNAIEKPIQAGTSVFTPAPNFPLGTGQIVASGTNASKLNKGDILYSQNGWYKMMMQFDGNLVIYNKANQPVWNTGTANTAAHYAWFQADGNFVIYDQDNEVTKPAANLPTGTGEILCGNTESSKLYKGDVLYTTNGWYRLTMQSDGNLVLYNKANNVVWSTGTAGSTAHYAYFQADGNLVLYDNNTGVTTPSPNLPIGTGRILCQNTESSKLRKGQSLYAANGWFRLTMQNDGNLAVVSKSNVTVWSSGTAGSAAHYAYFQADGNLVLYDNTSANGGVGNPVWFTRLSAQTYPFWLGYSWHLTNDGELMLKTFNDTQILYRTNARFIGEPGVPAPGNVVWSSNIAPTVYPLWEGQRWKLEPNGELRLYSTTNSILWRTYTASTIEPGEFLPGKPLWFTNTPPTAYPSNQGILLRLENNGELRIYNASSQILWRNNIASEQEPGTSISIADVSNYYLKAVVRAEMATYSSLSKCQVLDIALRCQAFRRISGRQTQYGSENRPGYSSSDNGFQQRSTMFIARYRHNKGPWVTVPAIFVVRRAAEQDNYVYLKFAHDTAYNWDVQFDPVIDPLSEIAKNPELKETSVVRYCYLENSGPASSLRLLGAVFVHFTGYIRTTSTTNLLPPINQTPADTNEWDWFSLDGDTQYATSFDRGPEFTITAVTEQQLQPFDLSRLYKNLSLIGFNVFSGKALQDMRSFTAFATGGKPVRRLDTASLTYPAAPNGPTCFAPDIFLDTIIDKQDGIGNYAEVNGIDIQQLAISKLFCERNNLFFDGLIADRTNWREFWSNVAPFSLLEFARIGGRETLVPAVPYDPQTGAINRTIKVTALFNQGNILEDSYKEEFMDYDANVQDIIATVVYRSIDAQGVFAVNRSISVQRADTTENNAILQTFDLSAYVTTEAQAILFGKLMCNLRRHVRSSVEFKTYPTNSPINPGSYIYVDIGINQWNNIYTGTVRESGVLNTPITGTIPNGTYNILLYRSGNEVISKIVTVSNNTAPEVAGQEGWLFVLGNSVRNKRVFRVNEVSMDEEGEVTVRATIHPCDSNDQSLIADFSDALFVVRR